MRLRKTTATLLALGLAAGGTATAATSRGERPVAPTTAAKAPPAPDVVLKLSANPSTVGTGSKVTVSFAGTTVTKKDSVVGYSVSFGDKTTKTGKVLPKSLTHTWTGAGAFTVSAVVVDARHATFKASVRVTVRRARTAPPVVVSSPSPYPSPYPLPVYVSSPYPSPYPSPVYVSSPSPYPSPSPSPVYVTSPAAGSAAGLHVSGNVLLDGKGSPVVLHGVNRSGTEYECIQGNGIFEGPSDATSIAAMASWHINAVRVPLNEDCWLGINGAPAAYSGDAYRTAIAGYVSRLHAAGLVAILELHWTAAGTAMATGQQDMPDADHAPAFWTSVATAFRGDGSAVLDLFNEPHDVTWTCWRDGGDCGIGYQVAGMQSLLNAVRGTGATNPVMLGGLAYANDLSQWQAYRPIDPVNETLASWHSYNFNACVSQSCWDAQVAPVAAAVPLVTGEIGENDCAHGYIDNLMVWLDSHGVGYLGWGWDTFDCSSFPALISNYDGTPTAYGVGLRSHLATLAGS